jgi:hypothetical protein
MMSTTARQSEVDAVIAALAAASEDYAAQQQGEQEMIHEGNNYYGDTYNGEPVEECNCDWCCYGYWESTLVTCGICDGGHNGICPLEERG